MALGAAQLTGLARYQVPEAAGLYLAIHGSGPTGGGSYYQQFYKFNAGTTQFELLTGEPNTQELGDCYGGGAWDITGSGSAFAIHSLVAGGADTTYIGAWTRTSDSFNKVTSTWTDLATGSPGGLSWTRDGAYIALGEVGVSPYFGWYSWNGSVFTKLTNPTITPTSDTWAHGWNKDGDRLMIGQQTSPYYRFYSRSGTTLTAINPTFDTQPGSDRVFGIDYSLDGTRLAFVHENSAVRVYQDNGNDTFTLESSLNPASGLGYRAVGLSPDGECLIIVKINAVYAYGWTGSTWTAITAPAGFAGGDRRSISWSGDGSRLALKGDNNSGVHIYDVSGTGSSTTFSAMSSPFDTAPSVGYYGGMLFNDSPQNF